MQITSELQQALLQMSVRLREAGTCWLIGGSCGLLLQNVHLEAMPRDIDVYTDQIHTAKLHQLLSDRSTDRPAVSETDTYYSVLSHYDLNGYAVELVGGFKVRSQGSLYEVRVDRQLLPHAVEIELESVRLPLMPLGHELVFNILRKRADRYEAIGNTMRKNLPAHVSLLQQICNDNSLSEEHIRQIESLLGWQFAKDHNGSC